MGGEGIRERLRNSNNAIQDRAWQNAHGCSREGLRGTHPWLPSIGSRRRATRRSPVSANCFDVDTSKDNQPSRLCSHLAVDDSALLALLENDIEVFIVADHLATERPCFIETDNDSRAEKLLELAGACLHWKRSLADCKLVRLATPIARSSAFPLCLVLYVLVVVRSYGVDSLAVV